jgi:hypothetical protein
MWDMVLVPSAFVTAGVIRSFAPPGGRLRAITAHESLHRSLITDTPAAPHFMADFLIGAHALR